MEEQGLQTAREDSFPCRSDGLEEEEEEKKKASEKEAKKLQ